MEKEEGSDATGGTKKLMVAIDESKSSHYALEWALENLTDYISSSPLIIFSAQSPVDLGHLYAASYGSAPPDLVRTVQEQQSRVASALLGKAKDICLNRGVNPETITDAGDPKTAICEAVEKFNVNLLVIGNNGRGALKRALMGSVSNYCVHNAKCPVLVVKKPA